MTGRRIAGNIGELGHDKKLKYEYLVRTGHEIVLAVNRQDPLRGYKVPSL
jgi:hypothetical protein